MKRYIAYTAIFGGKDKVENFIWHGDPADCVCFTDSEAINPAITVIKSPALKGNSVLSAKIFKLFPHLFFTSHKYSIWIDGNMRLKKGFNPENLIKYVENIPLALYSHPQRDCVYEEAQECININAGRSEVITKQIQEYAAQGLPRHSGLAACGFLVRRHHYKALINLELAWWEEILKHSLRDQISFGYLAWKYKYAYTVIPGSYWENENYLRALHIK